jgi:cellulose 1,4-beta-cellobiosidase
MGWWPIARPSLHPSHRRRRSIARRSPPPTDWAKIADELLVKVSKALLLDVTRTAAPAPAPAPMPPMPPRLTAAERLPPLPIDCAWIADAWLPSVVMTPAAVVLANAAAAARQAPVSVLLQTSTLLPSPPTAPPPPMATATDAVPAIALV